MTVDSIYTPKVSAINASRTYSFTYESLGAESIFVSYLDAAGNEYPVASSEYTLTLYGVSPIYDGGQVVFAAAPPANMVEVKISRYTPRDQLVDYEPYTAFPAETHEFALDKLTMIAQETAAGEGGGSVDPNAFVPVSGTRVGVPMTGTIESKSNNQNYRLGIIGGGFDGYYLTDLKQDGLAKFVVAINNKLSAFDSDGQLLLSTVYDGSEDPSAAATVQYVLDAVGGPGAEFIPLTGTDVGAPVTGTIHFDNTALGAEWVVGIVPGVTDAMTIAPADGASNDFVLATGPSATGQWWAFLSTGELGLPDIDYSLVGNTSAVTKGYVDAAVSGGGTPNVYVPLAGTDTGFPISGLLQFENAGLNRDFLVGISTLPGFDDGFTIASQGSSGNPSNIYLVSSGTTYGFTPTGFVADDIQVGGILTDGIINSGGASFGGALTISAGGANITGGFTADDLTVTGVTTLAGAFTQQIIATNIAFTGAQGTGVNDAVKYSTLTNYVPTARTISTTNGITGGGSLAANRTLQLDTTVVRTTGTQSIAGNMTLTGTLTTTGGGFSVVFGAVAGVNNGYVRSNASGAIYQTASVAAADVELAPGLNLATEINTLQTELLAAKTKLDNMRAAFDGVADIMNATNPQKAQIATLLNSLGIT